MKGEPARETPVVLSSVLCMSSSLYGYEHNNTIK